MCWRRPIRTPDEIVRGLVEQVTGTVRWRESVLYMANAGVTNFYEVGAGQGAERTDQAACRQRHSLGCWHVRKILPRSKPGGDCMMFDLTGKTALVTGASGGNRRRNRTRPARPGRNRCDLRHTPGSARGACRRAAAIACMCCRAISLTKMPSKRWYPTPKKKWRSSTSWSPMPGSIATIFSCSCGTRIGTRLSQSI